MFSANTEASFFESKEKPSWFDTLIFGKIIFTNAPATSKNYHFQSGQKWLKNNHSASLSKVWFATYVRKNSDTKKKFRFFQKIFDLGFPFVDLT